MINMNYLNRFGIIGLFFLLFITSCNEKEEVINTDKIKVLFSVDDFEYKNDSRTSVDPSNNYAITWASGDVIGIFPRDGYQEPFIIPEDQVGKSRAEFDGGYWALKDGLEYNAYYPFDKANFESTEMKTRIPVTYLGQEQNGTTCSIGSYDYTYSDWKVAEKGVVSFKFHHIGSFLVTRVPLPKTGTYSSLTFNADASVIPTKGTYDLTASVPEFIADNSSLTTSLSLKLNNYNGLDGTDAVFYMMMPPVDLSSNSLTLTLTDSEGNSYNSSLPSTIFVKSDLIELIATPIDYNFAVEWVSLNKASISLYEGESFTLKASLSPSNAKNKNLTWESKDESIAVVENGVVTAISTGKTIIKATTVDGSNKSAECEVYVRAPSDGSANGHAYVDLGVRDSNGKPIYWATMNIGASKETNYGYYFAWGEIVSKYQYTYANNKWYDTKYTEGFGYTKYQIEDKDGWSEDYWNSIDVAWYDSNDNFIGDGLTSLQAEDDAATVNWGEGWRTPTQEDFQALIDNCIFSFEYPLIKISNKNDDTKFIYLPQAGYKKDYSGGGASQAGDFAMYWTSTLGNSTISAKHFIINDGSLNPNIYNRNRYLGQPIRPVFVPSN